MNIKEIITNPFFIIALLKVVYSFFIPLNILPGAPHDDTLFYNLGYNISNFKWLGDYTPTSHIKGPVYPIFISIGILFQIPIRVLESFFIALVSFYSINLLFKLNYNKNLIIIGYAILLFYPYQYGLIDFRILRDMIYPQICLLIFSSIGYIYFSIKNENRLIYNHSFLFGFSFFLYMNTREESIWLFPSICLTLLIVFISTIKFYKKLFKLFSFALLVFLLFTIILHTINFIKYESLSNNLFKNSDFQSGYGALHRIKKDRLLLESVSQDDFNTLFSVSPSLNKLKNYINSPQYKGWVGTACYAHESQGRDILKDSLCPNEMPVGFLLFAIIDAMWSIEIKTLNGMTEFMKNVSLEIDIACIDRKIICNDAPKNNMPLPLVNMDFKLNSFVNKLKQSIIVIVSYNPPNFNEIQTPLDVNGILKIRKKLNSFIFASPEINSNEYTYFDTPNLNILPNYVGWVDGIRQTHTGFELIGWAYDGNKKFDNIIIVSDGRILCKSKPNGLRPDINTNSPDLIGFTCNIKYKITTNPININVYAFNAINNSYSNLNIIDYVSSSLSNKYNEECYLKYNKDVLYSQLNNKISGFEHWKIYGFSETRKCYSLGLRSASNSEDLIRYSLKNNIIYEYIIFSYHLVLSNFWFLILFSLFFMLFSNQLVSAYIVFILFSVILVRVVLISALDVVGMAPVSGMYLASGVYFYFITFLFSILFILNEILNKLRKV